MRKAITCTFVALGLVMVASAQNRDRSYYDREPGRYDRGPNYDLAGRVISHLDEVRPGSYWDRGEMRHVEKARIDLSRFRDDLARGHYDRGRLDNAIEHIDHLARSNHVPPRERDLFQRDVYDLREYRARGWDRH